MKILESYPVPKDTPQTRLSDFVVGIFKTIPTKKGMKKAIEKGLVTIDDRKGRTGDYIAGGEIIALHQEELNKKLPSIKLDLEVIFEDEHLAIINKPAGIVVSGNQKRTVENALSKSLQPSEEMDALPRPDPIHRLDHPTSGALLVGKTRKAVVQLNKLFEERKIIKTYTTITIDTCPKEGVIETAIKEKPSKTSYKVIKTVSSTKYKVLNLMEVSPVTGRRHQLRIHLSEQGNPILGDDKYGKEGLILKGKGLFLHATSLSFEHPITSEVVDVTIPLPKKFLKIFPEDLES